MQKLLEALTARLSAFVDQRDDLALVVRCTDAQTVLVLKALEGIDDASTSEMFWIFSEEFQDANSYVAAVVEAFAAKHLAVRLGMEREGMEPWPPVPPVVLDETLGPVQRLRELMVFSRELLPALDGFLAAWGFVPLAIHDRQGFRTLFSKLFVHEFPQPWCHHMRIYVRGSSDDDLLPSAVSSLPRVAVYEPDLSQAAMQRALEEEAEDPALPLERRLQSLFFSAHIDYAYGRFPAALDKYAILLKYHTGVQNETMTALVLNAVGETHARMGNAEHAGQCFELAFAPAAKAQGPPIPVMLNVVLNLANLRMGQKRWEEAEAYYDSAHQLASVQRDAGTKVSAIENMGECQYQQGKIKDALATWHAGAALAGELDLPDSRRSMLERLATHYKSAGESARHAEVQKQMSPPSDRASLPPA